MNQRIRMLIADDNPHSRKGLRALLATYSSVEVVCEAKDGREAVRLVEEYQPNLVLMDIQMPHLDGLEATGQIKARWPDVRVIVLTIRARSQLAAISAGADGFLLKGCPSEELFAEIQRHGTAGQPPQPAKPKSQSSLPAPSGSANRRNPLKIALSTG
jgi:DNA-binding NarL/FixJ family response regulator